MRSIISILCAIGLIAASPASAQEWSSQPWLDDLAQVRQAFETKYANIDWLEHDREMPLAALFDSASSRLRSAQSDEEAKAVFDWMIRRIGDGHVSIEWQRASGPTASTLAASSKSFNVCDDMGFDE